MKKIKNFSNYLFLLFCFLPLVVLAVEIPNPLNTTSFTDLLNRILDFLIKIAMPISAAAIAYAGFLFLTSEGDERKIREAKTTLFWTLIGVLIVLGSKGLVLIIKDLLGVKVK